jgi:hypothetical protein
MIAASNHREQAGGSWDLGAVTPLSRRFRFVRERRDDGVTLSAHQIKLHPKAGVLATVTGR